MDDLEKFASMCHADVIEKPTDVKIDFIEASKCMTTEYEIEVFHRWPQIIFSFHSLLWKF